MSENFNSHLILFLFNSAATNSTLHLHQIKGPNLITFYLQAKRLLEEFIDSINFSITSIFIFTVFPFKSWQFIALSPFKEHFSIGVNDLSGDYQSQKLEGQYNFRSLYHQESFCSVIDKVVSKILHQLTNHYLPNISQLIDSKIFSSHQNMEQINFKSWKSNFNPSILIENQHNS